ncbi:hypothetical protein [Pseudomonas chlororaphis]|uniref:hypothetical protein n=1 Tax=Pseudomonas chlororaphis TaxID=587753 RepID=UPI0005F91837|nr:hypothetical protein [Pseudomonas chlororaphis]
MTGFSNLIWQWYGAEEHERIAAICEAIPALEFLAMDAELQQLTIPDCPACEVWSSKMLPIHATVEACGAVLPDDVSSLLGRVWGLCQSLNDLELPCHDRTIFEFEQWQPLREAARQVLIAMEAEAIEPFLSDLS